MSDREWIGVDLDGTLARYDGWKGPRHIGEPIPAMVERVKRWLSEGLTVKIFTARAHGPQRKRQVQPIKEWCLQHIGMELEVTNVKDQYMRELYDDRCVQIVTNTGERVDGK